MTEAILATVIDDIDFTNVHHASFDAVCLENWPPYTRRLFEDHSSQDFILYRYLSAFEDIRRADPEYFATLRTGPNGFEVVERTDETRYLTFTRLVKGYELQLGLIEDRDRRMTAVQMFGHAVGNSPLAADLFRNPGANDAHGGIHSGLW